MTSKQKWFRKFNIPKPTVYDSFEKKKRADWKTMIIVLMSTSQISELR